MSALPVVASTLAVSLEVLFDKIKQLPPQRLAHAAAKASDEDAAYDWRWPLWLPLRDPAQDSASATWCSCLFLSPISQLNCVQAAQGPLPAALNRARNEAHCGAITSGL